MAQATYHLPGPNPAAGLAARVNQIGSYPVPGGNPRSLSYKVPYYGVPLLLGSIGAIGKLRELLAAEEGAAASDLPELNAARSQLEAKFYHASDFGVTEPRGAAGFDAYGKAVDSFVSDSSTIRTAGTYRGNPAILNYNPESRLVVVQAPSGEFVSGWQMSEQQVLNVIERGSLGGG